MEKIREYEEKIAGKWEINDLIMEFKPFTNLLDHPAGLEIHVSDKNENLQEVWIYYLIEQDNHVMIKYSPETLPEQISHIQLLNENMMIWHTPQRYKEPLVEIFMRMP